MKNDGIFRSWSDFNGTWKEYIKHLDFHDALSPKLKRKYFPEQIQGTKKSYNAPYKDN